MGRGGGGEEGGERAGRGGSDGGRVAGVPLSRIVPGYCTEDKINGMKGLVLSGREKEREKERRERERKKERKRGREAEVWRERRL